jgi:D-3-phosphoglycerate dehydrogenase / 2-oxoglutarate reductase
MNAPADVLIVEPLDSDVLSWLAARYTLRLAPELALDARALRRALAGVRALVVPPTVAIDAQTLLEAPQLRIVGRLAQGVDQIDIEACGRAGVEVVRPASAQAPAEAEFAVAALLQMLRRMPIVNSDGFLVGRELGHCAVGLVGLTPAAKPLTALLKAFGATVVGHDPGVLGDDSLWSYIGVEAVTLPHMLARCDAVCVLLNDLPRYAGFFNDDVLAHCKEDQVLLCLGNAMLFDEEALARELTSGAMRAAWFDHIDANWLAPGRPLRDLDSLQVTPRIAGLTQQARARGAWAVAGRIHEVLAPPAAPHDSGPGGLGGFRPSQRGELADPEDA